MSFLFFTVIFQLLSLTVNCSPKQFPIIAWIEWKTNTDIAILNFHIFHMIFISVKKLAAPINDQFSAYMEVSKFIPVCS